MQRIPVHTVVSAETTAKAMTAVEGLIEIGRELAAQGVRVTQDEIRAMRDEGRAGSEG
jgi:hypothetical protein